MASSCGGGTAHTEPTTRTEPVGPPPVTVVNARGEHEASGRFGSPGGSLELASGFRVEIPAGALREEVELHLIDGAEARVFHPEDGEAAVGPIADLVPFVEAVEGRTFRVSAPMAAPPAGFDDAEVTLGMEEEVRGREMMESTRTRWQYHHASVVDGRYLAEVAYFGGHRLQFGLSRAE
jgi:hypothetical protein